MRKIVLTFTIVALFGICPSQAATWWDSGHHVVTDANDPFGEIFMSNDATADILGGEILKLETSDFSSADIFGGEMDGLWTNDDTIVNIYGGTLNWLGAFHDSDVNLYAYDVVYHSTDGLHNEGWLEGTYYSDDSSFSFSFYGEDSYSHVNVIPEPATYYVDANATGLDNGSSWTDAYNYLQDALADANSNPDVNEIWVAQGTYTPDSNSADPNGTGDREATFQLINGVALYGGFPPGGGNWEDRDPNTYETILSGDLDGNDTPGLDPCDLLTDPNRGENSYHVVSTVETDNSAVLDGFIITGGNANGDQQPIYFGGGIYNENQPSITFECTIDGPTIKNCTIKLNSANGEGGGMYNRYSCNPQIIDCVFVKNIACWSGGAIKNDTSNPTIKACTFDNNISWISTSAHSSGGAIDNEEGDPTCIGCVFRDNEADYGGAVSNWMGWCDPTFINCIFIQNTALYGGVLWVSNHFDTSNPEFINCTLADNSAMYGNAVACEKYSEEVINPSTLEITNCILWDGGDEIWSNDGSTITINYSNVQGSGGGGTNIDADPCFADANSRLSLGSPCIDAGDNGAVPADSADLDGDGNTVELIPWDIDGNPRFIDGDSNDTDIVDMGAYEFIPPVPAIVDIHPQTLNLQSKGVITAFIELPEPYSVEDIDVETVECEGAGAIRGTIAGDILIVKFDRQELQELMAGQEVELLLTGRFADGAMFEGTDVIRVIDKAGKK